MTDASPQDAPTISGEQTDEPDGKPFPFARTLWAIGAVLFLAWVALGSVSARIWRFNRLYFEDRRILEVWRYEGSNLPDVPFPGALIVLYYGAVLALVVGTILGLWYLLDETGFRSQSRSASPDQRSATHE